MTASENVDNKNYESPMNPSEVAPDTKPTSPSADGTQVTEAEEWDNMGFVKDFAIAMVVNPTQTRETLIGSQTPRCVDS